MLQPHMLLHFLCGMVLTQQSHTLSCGTQVVYKVYEHSELQPLLDAANTEKEKEQAEEA